MVDFLHAHNARYHHWQSMKSDIMPKRTNGKNIPPARESQLIIFGIDEPRQGTYHCIPGGIRPGQHSVRHDPDDPLLRHDLVPTEVAIDDPPALVLFHVELLYQPVGSYVALRDTYPLGATLYYYGNLVDEYMALQPVQPTLDSDREICSGFQ